MPERDQGDVKIMEKRYVESGEVMSILASKISQAAGGKSPQSCLVEAYEEIERLPRTVMEV